MPGGIPTALQRHVGDTAEYLRDAEERYRRAGSSFKTVEQGAATSVLLATWPPLDGIGGRYSEDCNEAPVIHRRAEHSSTPLHGALVTSRLVEHRVMGHHPSAGTDTREESNVAERRLAINHVEMIFQPGKREAARAFFEAMGFGVSDFGPWLVILVDPKTANAVDNVMYASEPVPAQQKFEDALQRAIAEDANLSAALEHFRGVRPAHPQYNFHFGVSIPTHEDWTERTERVKEAASSNPLLEGHVEVSVFNPGDPGSVGPVHQTFILTDIVSTGTLQTGLIFELQWYPVVPGPGEVKLEAMAATATYRDPETLSDLWSRAWAVGLRRSGRSAPR
jgi:hypothetical protein